MKVVAIVQARMLSNRLRGKSLMSVNNKPLLYRVVEGIKALTFIDRIIVATTTSFADDPIEAAAKELGVGIFRGDALDVLNRFVEASLDCSESDLIVRFTADNPLYNTEISQKAFEAHVKNKADYTHIHGLSHIVPEFFNVGSIREANLLTRDSFDREHVTPFFRKKTDLFNVLELPNDFEGLRPDLDALLTIDTNDQLYAFEKMLETLDYNNKKASLSEIYSYLDGVNHKLEQPEKIVVKLDGIPVGEGYPTYIIAEIGQNHNGDVRLAKKLIDMAVDCGANAVKFQKRDIASELTKEAFDKPYENPNSFGATYGEHRIFLELDEAQHLELKEYALARGITYFCTPCDVPSVELLERINCPFYKVASRDLTNIPLLEALGKTGKPVILSTGMADFSDIDDALAALNMQKDQLIILQCTSQYPCALENVNLKVMDTLREKYGLITGFSDHTSGIVVSTAASVLGAVVIEKHITLDRTMKGTDQPGSLERAGLFKLVDYIRACEIALGDGVKAVNPATIAAKHKLARSLTSRTEIKAGTILTAEMICLKSPGTGIGWRDRGLIVGKKALRNINADVTLNAADFE
ncbi:MAG: N-acetylneuraminate synthase family protein [Saprospiraceae bacterium]|nr:N-acetylneuraminate synthase family protein [Saprospiraceae bacterium]MCB9322702.1 N-acetylneuraminate synthase family protein [Lewinellaceae bacterium]